MTTTDRPTATPGIAPHRTPWALAAAAVVAVTVVALVMVVGVARPPALERVRDGAEPAPAELATLAYEGGDSCLTIVAVDGTTRRPWCTRDGGQLVGWDDDGVVVRTYRETGEAEVVIDPVDGEIRSSRSVRVDAFPDAGQDELMVTSSRATGSGELEVRDGDGQVLWRVRAPDSYEVTGGWRSPDGDTIVLRDNARRLLLVPADGSAEPRVWTQDVGRWSDVAWDRSG